MSLNWKDLLSEKRRTGTFGKTQKEDNKDSDDHRTPVERDYDRILFSTPVRRLADKTQVFPLEENDSVRTRLTHSLEVSNLAKSIGISLVTKSKIFSSVPEANRNVPTMLAAAGLVHDLGNPPFGHQGEAAIGSWFQEHFNSWETKKEDAPKGIEELNEQMKNDFKNFEGNAQTLRLVSRLQLLNNNRGLNLTMGTLGALMKYTVPSHKICKKSDTSRNALNKKHGYFFSENEVVEEIRSATGLSEGARHPMAFIMEASDDIAYSVLDIEDAVKKGLISVMDVVSFLEHSTTQAEGEAKELTLRVVKLAKDDIAKYRNEKLSPSEFNDVSMQKLRVHAISKMIVAVRKRFEDVIKDILEGSYSKDLISDSPASHLCEALTGFAKRHAYNHRSVLRIELQGYRVIRGLMDIFWSSIQATREERADPFQRYTYGQLSENYRRIAEDSQSSLPPLYRNFQLLTDMISGMTDGFAVSLYDDLQNLKIA
ncbi:MAG: dNTP triphosphohydrolase [Negativicutes bacterium]|nr:dNTP triphosphohydrolase [Negativicutes bacterium]